MKVDLINLLQKLILYLHILVLFSLEVNPAGTEIEGILARFTKVVNKSLKYISRGSSTFEPSLNAAVGQVGHKIKSKLSKTFATSF